MSVESLQAKQAVIDEIKDKFERAKSAVVVDYMGITVEEADSMRKQLREAGRIRWLTVRFREQNSNPLHRC